MNTGKLKCQDEPWNGREQSIVVRVPPLAGMVLKKTGALRRPAKKKAATKAATKSATAKKPAAKKAASTVKEKSAKKPAAKKKASAE